MLLLKKIVWILFLVILLPFAVFLWPTSYGGDTEFLIVNGNSMLPTIQGGSLVITKEQPAYQIDDIVSFTQKEGGAKKIIVHRIIGIAEQGFVIKGDNNPKKDSGFPTSEDIKGKVIFATPYFGELMLILRSPVYMVLSSVVIAGIQWKLKRRKMKKEKLRRIRLGLPKTINLSENAPKKPIKADYKPFFAAIIFNVITYVLVQVSLSYHLQPKGDIATGFLYRVFEPSFASTVSFGLYFLIIFGLYFLAKLSEARISRAKYTTSRKSKSLQLLVKKNFNPVLLVTQFLCVLFIIMSLFYLLTISTELIEVVTCDPTQELC